MRNPKKTLGFEPRIMVCTVILGVCILGLLRYSYAWTNYPAWSAPNPVVGGSTLIRAQHITELRTAINNKRTACGLAAVTWAEAITAGTTPVRGSHITELRNAVMGIYNSAPARILNPASFPTGNFTDPALTAGSTFIRAVHINELRTAVDQATCCGDGDNGGGCDQAVFNQCAAAPTTQPECYMVGNAGHCPADCTSPICTGMISNTLICPQAGESPPLNGDVAVKLVDSSAACSATNTTDADRCQFYCDAANGWIRSGSSCVKITCPATTVNDCVLPSGIQGGATVTSAQTSCVASGDGCAATCTNLGTWNITTSDCANFICTGADPAHATLCSGDDTGLSADTPKDVVGACTLSKKCEYICDVDSTGDKTKSYTYYAAVDRCVNNCGECIGVYGTEPASCGPTDQYAECEVIFDQTLCQEVGCMWNSYYDYSYGGFYTRCEGSSGMPCLYISPLYGFTESDCWNAGCIPQEETDKYCWDDFYTSQSGCYANYVDGVNGCVWIEQPYGVGVGKCMGVYNVIPEHCEPVDQEINCSYFMEQSSCESAECTWEMYYDSYSGEWVGQCSGTSYLMCQDMTDQNACWSAGCWWEWEQSTSCSGLAEATCKTTTGCSWSWTPGCSSPMNVLHTTSTVVIRDGDKRSSPGCAIVKVDDPWCWDYAPPGCPYGCNDAAPLNLGETCCGDSCFSSDCCDNKTGICLGLFTDCWKSRTRWMCVDQNYQSLNWGAACAPALYSSLRYGKVNPLGVCKDKVLVPAACYLPSGTKVNHGSSVTTYLSTTVACDKTCAGISQTSTCNNGAFVPALGSYTQTSCSVLPCDCYLQSKLVPNGTSTLAYLSSSVPCGSTCTSQTRTCTNGILSGSYRYASCSVEPCSGCFIAGTKILMADGTLKFIEEIEKGEKVQGSDGINDVEELVALEHEGWLYSLNGGDYFVTEVHPFMTQDGIWKAFNPEAAKKENPDLAIEELKAGDVLVTRDGFVELTRVERISRKETVYNIIVNNSHDYYANGYLVHNKLICMPDPPYCPSGYVCESGICVKELLPI